MPGIKREEFDRADAPAEMGLGRPRPEKEVELGKQRAVSRPLRTASKKDITAALVSPGR